jgi:spermidine/putrescine transport system ATP-binding protein
VGTPQEIYDRPATRFVADFIGESNFLEGRVVAWDGKKALVQIGSLSASVISDRPLALHQWVTVAVRPERLRLCPCGRSPWTGQVEELIYSGKETRYRVRVSPEVTLLVSSPVPNGIGVGDRVGVEWDEHSLRLLDHEALL